MYTCTGSLLCFLGGIIFELRMLAVHSVSQNGLEWWCWAFIYDTYCVFCCLVMALYRIPAIICVHSFCPSALRVSICSASDLVSPLSRLLADSPAVSSVKKCLEFYGTDRPIMSFRPVSWARIFQTTLSHLISWDVFFNFFLRSCDRASRQNSLY